MLIGLTGFAGTGKDTVADILSEHHGFSRIAFADRVREIAFATSLAVRGVVGDLGWDRAKREDPWIRSYLQKVGMAHREVFGPDFWVDQVADLVREAPDGARFVVTDVRFQNEADWVQREGVLVRVIRPGVGPVNGHVSETALKDFEVDYVIENVGDLSYLRQEVGHLMAALRIAPTSR